MVVVPNTEFFQSLVILFGGQYSDEPLGSYVYEEQTKINAFSVNPENLKNDQSLMSGNNNKLSQISSRPTKNTQKH